MSPLIVSFSINADVRVVSSALVAAVGGFGGLIFGYNIGTCSHLALALLYRLFPLQTC
jgi:hypothetical protein